MSRIKKVAFGLLPLYVILLMSLISLFPAERGGRKGKFHVISFQVYRR